MDAPHGPLSPVEFHVLLVLAAENLYGYAILKAIDEESGGAVSPEIGSLYRVLGRLMSLGYVDEVDAPAKAPEVHRGRTRRYYRLTRPGRAVLKQDARRLEHAVSIARDRRLLPEPGR